MFEQNDGQVAENVRFVVRRLDQTILFLDDRITFAAAPRSHMRERNDPVSRVERPSEAVTIEFAGASRLTPRVEQAITARGTMVGVRGEQQRFALATSIVYPGLYPDIDLRFHNADGRLRYEFVIAAGAVARDIRFRIPEARRITIDESGGLVIHTASGALRHSRPVVYATANGSRRPLQGRFRVLSRTDVGFAVSGARTGETVHIDPELTYSTYLGGTESGWHLSNVTDPLVSAHGHNVDVYFQTASAGFPGATSVTQSEFAAVLYRFDCSVPQSPVVVFMVVFPSLLTGQLGLASASDGSVYVLGATPSSDPLGVPADAVQPTPNHPTQAPFLARVEANGDVQRVTYLWAVLGPRAVAVEADGASPGVYVTGSIGAGVPIALASLPAYMQNPVQPPRENDYQEVIVLKLDLSLRQTQYVTFIGGSEQDGGMAIAVQGGQAWFLAFSRSSDYPVTASAYQSPPESQNALRTFLTGLDDSGVLTSSGFLGYMGRAVDLHTGGEAFSGPYRHVSGTGAESYETIKVSPTGSSLVFRTTPAIAWPMDVAADEGGGGWAAGAARDPGLATAGAVQSAFAGGTWDGFVALFSTNGMLEYFTYLGGDGYDNATSIAREPQATYVVGLTSSTSFPITSASALQPSLSGVGDVFFAIFSVVPIEVAVTKVGAPGEITENGHVMYTVTVTNAGAGAVNDLTIVDQADADLILFPPAWQSIGPLPSWSSSAANSYTAADLDLGAGQSVIFTVEGVGLAEGTLQNCVRVLSASTVLASSCEATVVSADVQVALSISVEDDVPGSAPEGTQVHYTVTVTNTGTAAVSGVRVHHLPSSATGSGGVRFANVASVAPGFFDDPSWTDADGYAYVFNSIAPSEAARLFVTSTPVAKRGTYHTHATATVLGSVDGPWSATSTTGIGVVTADLETLVNPPIAGSGANPHRINVDVKREPPVTGLPGFQLQVEIVVDPAPFPPAVLSPPDGSSPANAGWIRLHVDATSETWVAVFNVAPNFTAGTATIRLPANVVIQSVRAVAGDPGIIDADGAESSWP